MIMKQNTQTDLAVFPYPADGPNNYKVIIGDIGAATTIGAMPWNTFLKGVSKMKRSEGFLIEAVRNSIRKTNLFELNDSFDIGEIDEKEYYRRLEEEEDKYTISLKDIQSEEDAEIIIDLIEKIGLNLRDLSTSEVAEMFSINENQLLSSIDHIKKFIK